MTTHHWTVEVRYVGWLAWRWTVSRRSGGAYSAGESWTEKGAKRAAERWIRHETRKRDSRRTWEVEA